MQRLRNTDISPVVLLLLTIRHVHCKTLSYVRSYSQEMFLLCSSYSQDFTGSLRLKYDGTRAETRIRLSAKPTSPFKSAGASVQSTTGSRVVRIRGSNAGYTMFRGSVKSTGYPPHSPVSHSLPLL